MSRGIGHLQRRILEELATHDEPVRASFLAFILDGLWGASADSDRANVARALRSLRKRGLVETSLSVTVAGTVCIGWSLSVTKADTPQRPKRYGPRTGPSSSPPTEGTE